MKIKIDAYPIPFGCVSLGISFHSGNFFRTAVRFDLLFFTVMVFVNDAAVIDTSKLKL